MAVRKLTRYAGLSIVAAIVTIGLKTAAYRITGSVGLLSDALESLVNLGAAFIALWVLIIASRPADEDHEFGHTKAEYFASAAEGTLILVAAASIIWAAVERFLHPRELESIGIGVVASIVASGINAGVAIVLLRAGKRYHSITLEADAKHLLTDVWTTAGVVIALVIVSFTGWQWLDPLIAILVALNIVWTGFWLLVRSAGGFMDAAIPASDVATIREILARHEANGIEFHAIRTRQAGARNFVEMHVLVPGRWTVKEGHDLVEEIELEISDAIPRTRVLTHLEPKDDPAAHRDIELPELEG
jgi:cation diffusion facilitator family transporter